MLDHRAYHSSSDRVMPRHVAGRGPDKSTLERAMMLGGGRRWRSLRR